MRYTTELITVAYSGDLASLYLHGLSLARFWQGDKKWTVVVEDRDVYQRVINWANDNIVPNMTGWDVNVTVGPPLGSVDGWHRQQILKLWAAGESSADYSIVLDNKNFFIRNFDASEFFDNNKLKVSLFDKGQYSQDHLNSCQVLGIDPNITQEMFPITPFVWRNSTVRGLLAELEVRNYDIYSCRTLKGSEAALYWSYAQFVEDWVETKDKWAFGQYGGLTKENRLSESELSKCFSDAEANNAYMVVLHRFHMTPGNADILCEFLRQKDLIGDWKINFFKETFKETLYSMRPEAVEILSQEWNMPPLKVIKRNQREVKFNRVIAFGCSHTAGSELADHLFFGKDITVAELDKMKREVGNGTDFYSQHKQLGSNEMLEAQGKLSWAGQVAEKLGVPILNRGIAGSSMQGIIYAIEKDRFDGVITDTDLILIGATSMDRWMYFEKGERWGWPWPATPIIGYPGRWPSEQFHDEFTGKIADDYFLFFNYYMALRYFDLLNKQLENRVVVQFMHHTMKDYVKFVSNKELNKRFMGMVSDLNNFDSIIDQDICLGQLVDWKSDGVHGFYHPHAQFHEQLAQQVVDRLLNNE